MARMIHPRFAPSSLFLLLLIAMLFAGCPEKQSLTTEPAPDTDNPQAVPVDESAQRQPAAKHIASTPTNATVSRQPPLDISTLLLPSDVEKILGQKKLKVEALVGQPATADYNGLRIVVENNKTPMFGAGLQVWKFADLGAASAQLGKLKDQYLGVQAIPADLQKTAGDGFIAERGGIRSYLVIAPPNHIIALSCEKDLCQNWADLLELARIVQSRL